MTSKELGDDGEKRACQYLLNAGYEIIERNWRTKAGELDIIVFKDDTLVFVEVKTRKTDICGHPMEAITKSKYNHIKQGLYIYLQENPQYKKFRIDAVSVLLKPELKIEHLKNI